MVVLRGQPMRGSVRIRTSLFNIIRYLLGWETFCRAYLCAFSGKERRH